MRSPCLFCALIVGAVVLVYGNTLSGGFHYDDYHSIVQNPHIRDLGNAPAFLADPGLFSGDPDKAMYRPLLLLSYALNHAVNEWLGLDGYEVWGYHLVNLLLHAVSACLVGWLGMRLAGSGAAGLAAGLLFAVHPLGGEPVNYISSRSESLAGLFYLLGVSLFVRGGGWRIRVLSWGALGLGLLSKSTVITLPAVLLLYDYLFVSRRQWRVLRSGWWSRHVGYWLIAAGYVGLILHNRFLTRSLGGPVRDAWTQLLTQAEALVYCVRLLLWPVDLSVEHQFFEQGELWSLPVMASLLLCASLLYLVYRLYRGRYDLGFFLSAWGLVVLLPVLVVPLNVLVNERRLYLSCAALCLGLGWLFQCGWAGRWRLCGWAGGRWVLCWLLLGYGLLTHGRNPVWSDELGLWRDAATRAPLMPRAHVHLGNALQRGGDRGGARAAYERALELEPDHRAARTNLGNLFYEAALAETDSARAVQYCLRAAAHYERVLSADSTYREALNNLGSVYLQQGRLAEADRIYHRTIEAHPHFAEAYFNLGQVRVRQGRPRDAEPFYRQALGLQPDAATHYELGNIHAGQGKLAAAAGAYREACLAEPRNTAYLHNLGEVLLGLGEEARTRGDADVQASAWGEARECFRRVLALDPANRRAALRLAQLEERRR